MRQHGAYDLDRADQVGVDLLADLLVAQLFCCAYQSVGGIADDDIDTPQLGKCPAGYLPNGFRIRHIQRRHPEALAELLLQVVEGVHLAQRRRHAVTARQQLLSQQTPETGRTAGDKPCLSHVNCPQKAPRRGLAACLEDHARPRLFLILSAQYWMTW